MSINFSNKVEKSSFEFEKSIGKFKLNKIFLKNRKSIKKSIFEFEISLSKYLSLF